MKTQSASTQAMLDLMSEVEKPHFRYIETAVPLMEHQRTAVDFVINRSDRNTALLALDMGTGKTATSISICMSSIDAGMSPVLVICPPSMRLQFAREFARFAPSLKVKTLEGTMPVKMKLTLPDADVLLCGDTQVKGWLPLLMGNVKGIILDECQRIKDRRAKRSDAILRIANSVPMSGIRVAMSGTPLIARPTDLIPVIRLLDRQSTFAQGERGFLARYAPRIDSYGTRGAQNLKELNQVLCDSFMLRMKREEVLTLPNHGRTVLTVEMDSVHARQYANAESNLYEWIKATKGEKKAENVWKAEALVRLSELRRIAGAGKVHAVKQYARELVDAGEQVFISAIHTPVLDAFMSEFENDNAVRISGGMSDEKKMQSVDAFQSGRARVLVGNVIAASVGLTLTSGRIHVNAELPWSSTDLTQLEARVSRNGQTRETISTIVLAGTSDNPTIDERIYQLIEHKNTVVNSVLDGESVELVNADMESIALAVLRQYGL
jgi:SNF2 family DNA or RNA helicase